MEQLSALERRDQEEYLLEQRRRTGSAMSKGALK
jgi:hypothetical protein